MLRQFIMNRPSLRNTALILGQINNYTVEPGQFEPYFAYEIGKDREDYKLYFSKLPGAEKYYNYIYLKLWAYKPHDAIKYLEYHYRVYPDKKAFLLFLKRDLEFRINGLKDGKEKAWLGISTISLEWVISELESLEDQGRQRPIHELIHNELTVLVQTQLQDKSAILPPEAVPVVPAHRTLPDPPAFQAAQSVEELADQLCQSLKGKLDGLVTTLEEKVVGLADKYETGDIQLANSHQKEKLIALLLCLKNLGSKPTRRSKTGDPIFTKMELNDIAQILRLHFAPYKGLKIDSIEKRIYEVNNALKTDDPRYLELNKALQKFFFN